MARPLRVDYPGAYYHVINRGNNQENIFKNKRDKEKFLEYLEKAGQRFSIIIHTYCLMNNHYHLLVQTPEPNLSVAMQWINVSYATYFNRKRGRHGHLFQGRFSPYFPHCSRLPRADQRVRCRKLFTWIASDDRFDQTISLHIFWK